jgi:ATP-binding cassette subfamily F protein 3
VLLLDEPTNHLDLETARWLEQYLRQTDRTVILVSHDRAFLSGVVDHVLHVEAGTMTPYAGTYEHFVAQRTERRLAQQRQFDKQGKVIAAQEDYIRRNLAGQNTKQAKGRPQAARPHAAPVAAAGGGRRDVAAPRGGPPRRRPGGGGRQGHARRAQPRPHERVLVRDFSARLKRGEVVGFVGPTGRGRARCSRPSSGEREPLVGGSLRAGDSIQVAHYRQDMGQVPFGRTCTTSSRTSAPPGSGGSCRGTSAASASRATRCCGAPTRSPGASGRAWRWR